MMTNKERIENLEIDLGGQQDNKSHMKNSLANKLH